MIFESKMITVKLKFEIQLIEDKRSHLGDFNKLIGFFNNLKTIHNGVIKQCCEEYYNSYPTQKLREEHKLKFDTIENDNFLNFSLSFQLNYEEVEYYLTLIKLFFDFCERYGKNTKRLTATIQSVKDVFENIKKLLEKTPATISKKSENFIFEAYNKLMKNENFRRAYNSFCKTGILITDLTSKVEDINDLIDFLDN
jgi:hypothetical protein